MEKAEKIELQCEDQWRGHGGGLDENAENQEEIWLVRMEDPRKIYCSTCKSCPKLELSLINGKPKHHFSAFFSLHRKKSASAVSFVLPEAPKAHLSRLLWVASVYFEGCSFWFGEETPPHSAWELT